MVFIKRKGKEPSEVIMRRFNREIQGDGMLTIVKKRRYHFKDISRRIKRNSALRKAVRKLEKRGY